MHDGAVQFFEHLLSVEPVVSSLAICSLIPQLVSDEDNLMLCRLPTLKEVRDATFAISQDSSQGLDGFGSSFFLWC